MIQMWNLKYFLYSIPRGVIVMNVQTFVLRIYYFADYWQDDNG